MPAHSTGSSSRNSGRSANTFLRSVSPRLLSNRLSAVPLFKKIIKTSFYSVQTTSFPARRSNPHHPSVESRVAALWEISNRAPAVSTGCHSHFSWGALSERDLASLPYNFMQMCESFFFSPAKGGRKAERGWEGAGRPVCQRDGSGNCPLPRSIHGSHAAYLCAVRPKCTFPVVWSCLLGFNRRHRRTNTTELRSTGTPFVIYP